MHFQSHTIIRLECHMPQQQNVYFREGREQVAIANATSTKLLAFFNLNENDPAAINLLYNEVPLCRMIGKKSGQKDNVELKKLFLDCIWFPPRMLNYFICDYFCCMFEVQNHSKICVFIMVFYIRLLWLRATLGILLRISFHIYLFIYFFLLV